MLEFLKSKMHRNTFFAYITVLFFVCVIVCFSVCNMILSNQVDLYKRASSSAFNGVESSISNNISKIDNYFLGIYSNRALEKDFLCFFSHNAQEYRTLRLEGVGPTEIPADFLKDVKTFVQDNDFVVTQISVESQNSANIIHFYDANSPGLNVDFCVPTNSMDIYEDDVSYGYVYTKELPQTENGVGSIGEMKFLLSGRRIFDHVLDYNIADSAIMSKKGALYYTDPERQDQLETTFQKIYKSNESNGILHNGLFYRQYYFTNTSSQYGYKLITIVDSATIFHENLSLFLLVIAGSLLIFLIMTFLIAVRANYDAKFLNKIVHSIQLAKSGQFTHIDVGDRKDEYGVIAQEFNDMIGQLEEFIRTEYVLKLKQKETEMQALQHQINPHFLYNTLEIIRSCALVHNDLQVADAVYYLGSMYRDIVKEHNTITIEKELDILGKYLKIMEFKYDHNFYYQIDVSPEVRSMETIKLWMQPLVENFFVHGFDRGSEFNLLLINGREETDRYIIEIINNGSQVDPEKLEEINSRLQGDGEPSSGSSIGIQNVYHRLRFFYGERLQMQLCNNTEAGITVSIRIYKKKEENLHVSTVDRG